VPGLLKMELQRSVWNVQKVRAENIQYGKVTNGIILTNQEGQLTNQTQTEMTVRRTAYIRVTRPISKR
jgi:hypothetical protein